jgi:cation:H+ antiporter
MLIFAGLIVLGLVLLVGGSEALLRGASGIALLARVSPAVVGLTIVAAGTSMPEMVVSVQSAIQNRSGLSLGNVVGSNILNIAAILGIAALIRPLTIQSASIRFEWPVMLLSAVLLHMFARDTLIDRMEGIFFGLAMVIFTAYAVWLGRTNTDAPGTGPAQGVHDASFGRTGLQALAFNSGAVVIGAGALAGGSTAFVAGASGVAAALGVPETVIGLTIVAAGTSTPELVTSIVAALRGSNDVAVGNIIGSNIFNSLAIVGVSALIVPLPVPAEILERDDLWMIGLTLLLFPLMRSGMSISRLEGVVLAVAYLVYLAILLRSLG